MSPKLLRVVCRASYAIALMAVSGWAVSARADPIVGTWVGKGTHTGKEDQFNMRLTFVSPRGGVSRYPDVPCGGKLVGGPRGDDEYEYDEAVTFNGPDERSDNYCVGGRMRLSVDGNKMKYDWASTYHGENFASTGELRREPR